MSFVRIGTSLISTENIRQMTLHKEYPNFIGVELYNKGTKRYEWVNFDCGNMTAKEILERIEKSSGEKKNG